MNMHMHNCTFRNAYSSHPLHIMCWLWCPGLSHSHENMTSWWHVIELCVSSKCEQVLDLSSIFSQVCDIKCEHEIFSCEYAFAGIFRCDHALGIVNRLSLSISGSASLRKVWAGSRWTLQATSRTASPLQASSGAGRPILQPAAHLYPKPGSLGNCLQLEGKYELMLMLKDLIGWPLLNHRKIQTMSDIEEEEDDDEDGDDHLHIHRRTSKDDDDDDDVEDADNENDDDEEPGCWWKRQPLDQIFVALPLLERNWTSLIMAH